MPDLPRRLFLDWKCPILAKAEELLLENYSTDRDWDLRDLLIILPSSLAKRRLRERLTLRAEAEGKVFYPPKIETVGDLPEHLYHAKFPFASDFVQILAWCSALRAMDANQLRGILPLPSSISGEQWLELGKLLSGLHRELASDRLDFSDVVQAVGNHPEADRWKVLASLQHRYLSTLDELKLWDIQTARVVALDYHEPRTTQRIIVIGAVDLNQTQRGFLAQVAQQVEVWIAAPESLNDMFDSLGCLLSEDWENYQIDIPEDVLTVIGSPQDQAELVASCLAELGPRYHAADVTLGIPDASLVSVLRQHLFTCGVVARHGPGVPLASSEPARLLERIGEYLRSGTFSEYAALVRHPIVEGLLNRACAELPVDWLGQLDAYYHQALPRAVESWINPECTQFRVIADITAATKAWLANLNAPARPISDWVQPLLDVLRVAYEAESCELENETERALYQACQDVCRRIAELNELPRSLQISLESWEAIDWLLRSMSGMLIPEPPNSAAVEMLGWLELALDDARALILTGMHDGVVPESINADMFLPNQLRKQLGMMDNARRYARDAFALEVMLNTRKFMRIVVGKYGADGDPMVPSRLLLACGLKRLPARVLKLVSADTSDSPSDVVRTWRDVKGFSRIDIPPPQDSVALPTTISVTAFRSYLECPYRFYLRHVLRLDSEHDFEDELDAAGFGNLLHAALNSLIDNEIGQATDAEQIRDHLIAELRLLATRQFGPHPPAAVEIQLEQAEERLAAFARKQAERAAQGWIIRYAESIFDARRSICLGDQSRSLILTGRIDRIDFNPRTGQWAIWDYKTGDTARKPHVAHISKNRGWIDLQLPLYRHLFRALFPAGDGAPTPSLGYILIPKKSDDIEFALAAFSESELADADRTAQRVVASILSRKFEPTDEPPLFDDFSRLCQTHVQRTSAGKPTFSNRAWRHDDLALVPTPVVSAASKILASTHKRAAMLALPAQLIRASAGTGKTFQLSNRLLHIILSGQDVDTILATTFTRKAAGEIMHRVLQRLAQACIERSAMTELATHLADVEVTHASCLAALRTLTKSLHRFRVSTLDSFFAQIARAFGLEMELSPGWSTVDPVQENSLRMLAIERVLDTSDRATLIHLVKMLSKGESQRRVVDEIAQTVESGYSLYRVTGREAWSNLRIASGPSESAIDSVVQMLGAIDLQHDSVRKELRKLADLVAAGNWERAAEHGLVTALMSAHRTYYKRELPDELCAALTTMLHRCAAELLPIRRAQTEASFDLLAAFDTEYLALLRKRRVLTFSDITHFLACWLDQSEAVSQDNLRSTDQLAHNHAQIAWRMDCGVNHLLLDEFQDTAPSQWRIIRSLARPQAGFESSNRSFFCVGDTKQAIYGWRGGVSEIFDAVSDSIQSIQEEQLNRSFRSSPVVMDVVNRVFENLTQHEGFGGSEQVAQRWCATFPEHSTAREELPGYVLLKNLPRFDKEVAKEERKQVELAYAADMIAELVHQSRQCSIGVLFRANDGVASMIELLKARGIAASQDGGNPLTDSCAVELLLSLIHLADHPSDTAAQHHVASSPLADHLRQAGYCDIDLHGPEMLSLEVRRNVSRLGLGHTLSNIAQHLQKSLNWWDQHRLLQLVELAYKFELQFAGRLRDFEQFVESQRVALPTESQVKVMTIHKSKGLEFDAVFLPDMEIDVVGTQPLLVARSHDPCQPPDGVLRYMNAALQRLLPETWQQAFSQWRDRQVSESMCLLYVAMTRAKSGLYMLTKPRGREAVQEFGSILQSTLCENELAGEAEATLLELGQVDWFKSLRSPTLARDSKAIQFELAFEQSINLQTNLVTAPRRNLRAAAPSGMGQPSQLLLSTAFTTSASLGAAVGTLIHGFFEQVQWLEDYEFDEARLREAAIRALTPDQLRHLELDRQIATFRGMLEMQSVQIALSRSRYDESRFGVIPDQMTMENERPINLVIDQRLISGTIDRLVVLWHAGQPIAAEIIDYKTDARSPSESIDDWVDERVEHHRPQLEVYAQVVAKMYQLPADRIACYLVLLSGDRFAKCPLSLIPAPHVFARNTVGVDG